MNRLRGGAILTRRGRERIRGIDVRKLGIIGGTSWSSTALYYDHINRAVAQRLGGLHSARLVIESLDLAPFAAMELSGDWDGVARETLEAAKRLEVAGAEAVVITSNTGHKVYDAVAPKLGVPMLHIGDATADKLAADGRKRVALLGTRFTMEEPFYRDRMATHGIEVVVPDSADRAVVHDVIYRELVVGVVSEASRDRFREIIARLAAAGAEGVILGCTEIELLVSQEDSSVPVFASTALHAQAAVDFALADQPVR